MTAGPLDDRRASSQVDRRAFEAYPPPPGAASSETHAVRVQGTPVFVERYAGVDYVRFALRGGVTVEVEVEVEVADPITSYSVFPAERIAASAIAGKVLTLALARPEQVVVRIGGLEPLFLLPDPIEDDTPVRGAPDVLDVVDHGADPTGRELATAVLQAAVDEAASRPGGGTVLVPPGVFRTGTVWLKSNVTLHLAAGALLQGSAEPGDYPLDAGRRESASDASLPPDARFLGRTMTFSRLLLVDRAHNVRIAGRGTIDGGGTFLRTQRNVAPNILRVRESSNVRIDDILFRNAAAWSLHVLASREVALRNVKIVNDRANLNTDGIDLDMSADVTVDRAFVYTKDDAICVKATGNGDLVGDPARIAVTNSLVSSLDAGLKIGSETEAAAISDIVFANDFVFDSDRAMSVVVRDGATVERVAFRGIRIGPNVSHLVEQVIGVRDPGAALGAALGAIRDLRFDGITAAEFVRPETNWTWYAQFRPARPGSESHVNVFEGADETHAVDGLEIRAFVVDGRRLTDATTAADVANLTIGPHVRGVTFG